MYLTYEEFKEIANKHFGLEVDFYVQLLKRIIDNPNRYCGIFRLTSAKEKIIQNVSQSNEIRFGDFLEEVTTKYIEKLGYSNLDKRCKNEKLHCDQLFTDGKSIYLVEQKVRDDHDSTKKRGQLKNFNDKIDAVIKRYPNKQIVAIMWFIDDALTKNKRYYEKEVDDLNKNNVNALLVYNGSFFMKLNNGQEAWTEFKNHLIKLRKEHLISVGVLDFDEDYKVHEAFCKLPSNYWAKFISGEDIYNTLRSELFTNEDSLKKIQAMMKEVKTLDEE